MDMVSIPRLKLPSGSLWRWTQHLFMGFYNQMQAIMLFATISQESRSQISSWSILCCLLLDLMGLLSSSCYAGFVWNSSDARLMLVWTSSEPRPSIRHCLRRDSMTFSLLLDEERTLPSSYDCSSCNVPVISGLKHGQSTKTLVETVGGKVVK
jgi:hypothetical protein